MRKTLLFLAIGLTFVFSGFTQTNNTIDALQEVAVTIKADRSQGSGVIFTRTNKEGETVNLVWTAAHVIDNLRREREVVAANGSKKTLVEFDEGQILPFFLAKSKFYTISRPR